VRAGLEVNGRVANVWEVLSYMPRFI